MGVGYSVSDKKTGDRFMCDSIPSLVYQWMWRQTDPNGASLCTDQVDAGTGSVAESVKRRKKGEHVLLKL